jgi:hypothetical protein
MRIIVTTAIPHGGIERLCPGSVAAWDTCEILLNPPPGTTGDYWIVWATSRDNDHMQVSPTNTLFIAGEPPSKKIYPKGYYAQFHRVVSTHAADPHPRVTTSLPGLPWHAGLDLNRKTYVIGYDELRALPPGDKSNRISVVCSNLTTTEGQRRRLAFLDHLKHRFGDRIVHYGRGFDPIDDKLDAILPHRFHLVLENSCSPDYWTEKLADAYLGWAFPIYLGCPNLADFFPREGFQAVDPARPEEAADLIGQLLETPATAAEQQIISSCRDLILDQYNPFARFAHWARRFHQPETRPATVRIRSHKAFRPFPRGLLHRMKSSKPPHQA